MVPSINGAICGEMYARVVHELSIMHDVIEGIVGSIVCGKFWYEESPWGLVVNDMRAERRGEHVI